MLLHGCLAGNFPKPSIVSKTKLHTSHVTQELAYGEVRREEKKFEDFFDYFQIRPSFLLEETLCVSDIHCVS